MTQDSAVEQSQGESFYDGELCSRFPVSHRFIIKKSLPFLLLIAFMMWLLLFGGEEFYAWRDNLRTTLGLRGPLVYRFGVLTGILLCTYWYFWIKRFEFGIKDGMLYIKKGVFMMETFDYPITSIENTAIKRDIIDFFLGLARIQLMTAHEASDDLAAIKGLSPATAEELYRYLRQLVHTFQSSRFDIQAVQDQISSVRAAPEPSPK